jgi:hypothetical protein
LDKEFRKLENDEWIKFGRVIYDSRDGSRKNCVLERYKFAWTEIYQSPAPLDNGAPANFLSNPAYAFSGQIPWFDQAKFPPSASLPASHPTEPAIAATSSEPTGTSGVPSIATSHPIPPPNQTRVNLQGQFPSIHGGLNNGFMEYLSTQEKLKIQVVFVLDAWFRPMEINAYNNTVDIDSNDAKEVMQEMRECIPLHKDQKGCKSGRKRYLCMSWVRMYFDLDYLIPTHGRAFSSILHLN